MLGKRIPNVGHAYVGPAVERPSRGPVAGGTAALVAGSAAFAVSVFASAGLITDPIQRLLGFHHSRLIRLLDTLEDAFWGGDAQLRVPEQYAAAGGSWTPSRASSVMRVSHPDITFLSAENGFLMPSSRLLIFWTSSSDSCRLRGQNIRCA